MSSPPPFPLRCPAGYPCHPITLADHFFLVKSLLSSDWSASLAFAPTRRPAAAKVKPARASAALYFETTPNVASSSKPTDAVRQAEPVIRLPVPQQPTSSTSYSSAPVPSSFAASRSPPPTSSSSAAPAARALPSMTIEEDVNGFKKRPGPGGGGRGGHGGGKKRKTKQPAGPAFDPHEAYDPSRPNDVLEYRKWRTEEKKRKERLRREKREKAAQEAKMGGGGGGGGGGGYPSDSDEGSYYSEDEREEQTDRVVGGMFSFLGTRLRRRRKMLTSPTRIVSQPFRRQSRTPMRPQTPFQSSHPALPLPSHPLQPLLPSLAPKQAKRPTSAEPVFPALPPHLLLHPPSPPQPLSTQKRHPSSQPPPISLRPRHQQCTFRSTRTRSRRSSRPDDLPLLRSPPSLRSRRALAGRSR